MKSGKIALIAVSSLLLTIFGILGNVLATNFPTVPRPLLWIGVGVIIVAFVAVKVLLAVVDSRQGRVVPPSRQRRSRPSQANLHHPSDAAQKAVQATDALPTVALSSAADSGIPEEGQPTIEQPMLLCLALDVSGSMKKPILDHTGKDIERWTSIHNALEHFVQLGVAWVKYPETQQVLPLYHLMAYGFGFKETMHELGIRVGSDVTAHQYTEICMLCKICGAGHALKLTRKPNGEIRATLQ